MTRRLLEYGASAVLVECPDLEDAVGLARRLGSDPIEPVLEVIPGARSLLLRLATELTASERAHLLELPAQPATEQDQQLVTIEVDYDGEDLEEVARLTGLTPAEVVQAHSGQVWTVGFCGFAPGFAYLHGEDDRLRVPRRPAPRTRVPPGSVGLADQWSGIYPREGPGGWQLIGRTAQPMWDLEQDPPALLQPGMRVQFQQRGAS
jgi:KipI family sensor histidine kinase inhibitor